MKALRAMPAMALAAVIALLAFAAALARPGVGAVLQANGAMIGAVTLVIIGWWAGALVVKAKGSLTDAAVAGIGVGVAHGITAIVLFGYGGGGDIGMLLDGNIVETLVALGGAVAGAGIAKSM